MNFSSNLSLLAVISRNFSSKSDFNWPNSPSRTSIFFLAIFLSTYHKKSSSECQKPAEISGFQPPMVPNRCSDTNLIGNTMHFLQQLSKQIAVRRRNTMKTVEN
ncbi:hypothetical protein KFK09_007343 [Dendrobium nobile]|uniref:Uncharacterized protein n=1 Tax=Dendrobium nobile TaxID=94219 RepID=A0A8T3BRL7_DENNO|nr:hypothetical protein KFK09_007343 [Dendrobium nobile]